jgi:hypothetical protein
MWRRSVFVDAGRVWGAVCPDLIRPRAGFPVRWYFVACDATGMDVGKLVEKIQHFTSVSYKNVIFL